MENNFWRSNSMDFHAKETEETEYYSSRKNTKKGKGRECCMCGDVGFQETLFRCHRCRRRFQHIYCSTLYSDKLELDGVNVCDWCLDFQAKEKIQSHKRKVELQEMEIRKTKELASNEIVSKSASTIAMGQPVSVTIEKPRKANVNSTLQLHLKLGGSKPDQSNQPSLTENKLSIERCRNLPGITSHSSLTKGGVGRRFKLLSDVLA